MPKFYFIVRCNGCGHDMLYHTDTRILAKKSKRCVYCGKTFYVKDHIIKEVRRTL